MIGDRCGQLRNIDPVHGWRWTVVNVLPTPTDQKVGGSSPSKRATYPQVRGHLLSRGRRPAGFLSGRASHNFSRDLAQTMDFGQRLAALLQVLGAGMDIGLLVTDES